MRPTPAPPSGRPAAVPGAAPPPVPDGGTGGGRARRSVLSWLVGMASTVVVALAGLLATPLLVRWLGDARWGAWTIIGEWLGYLGVTQIALGPGALAIFLLRAQTQSGGGAALTAVARRGLRIYAWAALALTPAAVALAWWAPLALHSGPELTYALRWTVAIAGLGSLALAPSLLLRSVLDTVQRGYLVSAALLVQSLLITGLSLWWVWRRWGLVGMAAANVVGMAVGAGLWWWWARRWLPRWRATAPAPLAASDIWHVNWPLLLASIGNRINLFTDSTVIGLMLSPAAVAGFALTQSLPLLAGARLTDVGGVSWAALGDLRARADPRFGASVIEIAASLLGAGTALMATLAVFNHAFVVLWVGARHYDGAVLTVATAAGMVVFSLVCFFSWLIDTQGDSRRRLWASTIGSALNLGLSLWLVRRWGVSGVAVGTLVAYLATDAWYLPWLAVRDYGVPGRELARALLGALGRGSLWAALMLWLAARLPLARTWPGLAVEAGLCGLAACAYCWVGVLRPGDRAAWAARWHAIRPRPALAPPREG